MLVKGSSDTGLASGNATRSEADSEGSRESLSKGSGLRTLLHLVSMVLSYFVLSYLVANWGTTRLDE